MTEKFATAEGTKKFAARFQNAAAGHFRQAQGLTLSSIGIGTYLGNPDPETDENYTNAVVNFVEHGGNVIDTAANYRFQRSERSIGKAMEILGDKGFERGELFISTKGGYLPFDGEMPQSREEFENYFTETFVETGVAKFEDLVGGSHCMTPRYLESQIDQSLKNMALECIDLFYIHNPESQLSEITIPEFEARLAAAFERLEEMRTTGKIQCYGVATWNGFRISPQQQGFHSLEKMVRIAAQVGGADHGFKFIQLPFNLAMPEAMVSPNQQCNGKVLPTLDTAAELGISVMCSASILQGRLAAGLPENVRAAMGNQATDAQTGIQFVRSAPNVTTALTGMSRADHVEENMRLLSIEPGGSEDFAALFA